MSMPRFTAEASVYRSPMHYRVSGSADDPSGGQMVGQAALSSPMEASPWAPGGGGWWHCWYIDRCIICCSQYWCWYYCRWGATQG